jgi:hypothetical protein
MKRTKEHTGSITARDAAGKTYRIDVYTEFLHIETLDGSRQKTAGMMSLKLNGQHVNLQDQVHATVVQTGLKLTLDHPLTS